MTEETTTIDPQKALRSMARMAPEYAAAKAERIYLEHWRKSLLAMLMVEALTKGHEAANAQDREARADDRYKEVLLGLKAAVEKEEALRWKLVAAEAAVEVWRTTSANERMMDRGTQ